MENKTKFSLREKVVLPKGERGIIKQIVAKDGSNLYLVKISPWKSQWVNEDQLTKEKE